MGGVEVEESSDDERGKAICDVMPSLSLLSVVTLVSNKQSVACTEISFEIRLSQYNHTSVRSCA
jgi:hypothetical protein